MYGGEHINETRTVSIRMPKEIFNEIQKTAEKDHRSISQQIVLYLENHLKEQEEKLMSSVEAEK